MNTNSLSRQKTMCSILPSLCSLFVLCTLLIAPACAEQIVVDAFGDSITSGVPYYQATSGNGCLPPCGGYEPELQRLLNAAGRDSAVRNYGVRGDTTSGGLQRIDTTLATSKPKYILLLEGTNEIYFSSPYTVRSNMSLMVDKALANNTIPIIGTLTPDSQFTSKPIPFTNDLLKELAESKQIPLADLYSATVSKWSSLSNSDGIHPNMTGYAVVAKTWFNAIVAWEKQESINSVSFLPAIHYLLLSD